MSELFGLLLYAFFATWSIMIVSNLKDVVSTPLSRVIVGLTALTCMYISGVCLYVFI